MLKVAILGFGVVGSGAAQVITENQDRITRAAGDGVEIRYILDLREFPDSPFASLIVHDFDVIVNDPDVDVVLEMMGGSHPAYEYTKAALLAGKHVVTSNKEVVANFGVELLSLAKEKGVRYLFEASVGGGIPVLRPLFRDLSANRVRAIDGILNGTTNYILTRMVEAGISFEDALAEAQAKGYAERNPSADVDGLDAARKIVILAAVASGVLVSPTDINTEGIRAVNTEDVRIAAELGYAVKLIGHAQWGNDGKLSCFVAPCFLPKMSPLAEIRDVYNGILITTDMLGQTMFYGRGAGKLPTAGAVVSDLMEIAQNSVKASSAQIWQKADVADMAKESPRLCRCLIFDCLPELPTDAPVAKLFGKAICTTPLSDEELADFTGRLKAAPRMVYRCLDI